MRRLLAGLLAVAWLSVGTMASAEPVTSLIVLGDSLSDGGNAALLTAAFFPPSPPYAFRFSNGPVAAEYLAQNLGVPLTPSVSGGTNYAVGGATTGTLNFNFAINSPPGLDNFPAVDTTGILNQVSAFLASGTPLDPATSLFMLSGGHNDIFLARAQGLTDPAGLGLVAQQAIANLATAVATLATVGAEQFLVPNMADLGRTPQFLGTPLQAGLETLATLFDAGLAGAMASLALQLGVSITVFDTFGAVDQILNNPAAFGFTNTTQACLANVAAFLAGCPGYVFFDSVHPTTAAHAILGDQLSSAVPGPSTAALLTAGAVVAGLACSPRVRAAPLRVVSLGLSLGLRAPASARPVYLNGPADIGNVEFAVNPILEG
jgi:phospholipase/lecithinase/hemolysin